MSAAAPPRAEGWPLPRSRRPVLLQAMAMAMDPEGFFERAAARRGDPFVVRMPSVGEVLMTGHPEGAREIFSAPPETFEPLRVNPLEPLLGRHSLLLLSGERHRRERRLMSPPFHGERMRAYGGIIRERTQAEVATWPRGGDLSVLPAMRRITVDVILRAVLGVEGEDRGARFRAAIVENLDAYTPPLLLVPPLRRRILGAGPWDRFADARDRVTALFLAEIADRRRRGGEGHEDILSLLMSARYDDGSALDDQELVDELRTLIVAGHDTTTTALTWALFHLYRAPSALAALQAELAGGDGSVETLAQLPYLAAVCSEALRLHPVVPIVPRRAVRPFTLRGLPVEPGQSVSVATTLLHTRPDVWPDPEAFQPERFLSRKYTPFEYAPFGGGLRRCIGAAFGAYQMRVVLGTVVSAARLAPHRAPTPPRALASITMGPRGPVKLPLLPG